MVLNAEKRARLADVLSLRDDVAAGVGASAPTAPPATQTTLVPASSAPITAIPLAAVKASPPPALSSKDARLRQQPPPIPLQLGALPRSGITHLTPPRPKAPLCSRVVTRACMNLLEWMALN